MFQSRVRSLKTLPLILLILLTPLIFAPMVLHMIARRGADYQPHIAYALQFSEGTRTLMPQPLFHLGVILTHLVAPGMSFTQAGFLFGLMLYIIIGIVIYSVYIRPVFGPRLSWKAALVAVFVTLSLMTLSAVTVFTWQNHNLYWGYIIPNVYHSPTLLTLRPIALLVFIYIVGAFSSQTFFRSRIALFIGILLMILTSLAKPNYTMAAIPALGLITLYRLWKKQSINWALVIGMGLPAVLILLAQILIFPVWTQELITPSGGGFAFAPLAFLDATGGRDGFVFKLVLSILFPMAVYALYFQKAVRDFAFNTAWLIFWVGAAFSYLFVEPGNRLAAGNFMWSAQITLFVLFVESAAFFLRQIFEPGKGFTFSRAAAVCIVIGLLHVASGVLWYATEISSVAMVERWW